MTVQDDRYGSSKNIRDSNSKIDGIHYFDLEYNNKVIGRSKPKDINLNLNVCKRSKHEDADAQFKHKHLNTKKPTFDTKTKTYKLDFKGRAKLPSTNNLQIIDEANDPAEILLQLGKMKSKHYSLDFSYPFCAFTAFGLAISCLSRN